jgi:Holliday junction resolvase RusA-like endonuclease
MQNNLPDLIGTIRTQPIPKGRPRFSRTGHAYTPERTASYENLVRYELASAMAWKSIDPYGADIDLTLTFRVLRKHKADLDNLIKAWCDAANGIVYGDDRQVTHIDASVVVVIEATQEGTDYRVHPIPFESQGAKQNDPN